MENVNGNGAGPEPAAGAGPVSSIEKLQAITLAANAQPPETEDQAALISLFRMASPVMARVLPDDPAELDRLLLEGAKWALALRSDDAAEPATIAELKDGWTPDG